MPKWEYLYAHVSDEEYDKTIEILNKYGEQGWEFTGQVADTGYGIKYLMKREVPNA